MDANILQRMAVNYEEEKLGVCLDLDMTRAHGDALSRADLHLPQRPCLVCHRPAHLCVKEGTHPESSLCAVLETTRPPPGQGAAARIS